ncbi:hypothetical protein [Vibrio parahaemolyticus]|uniref:hypothetical protein n=1 Tax=Vibrio parahaemolyticus TaxID=670 RepID=UPI000413A7EF|nr:hypothetical protein [Vibrio parahaemolyticus]
MKRQKARKNVDYTLDPITSRATFKKNNKAALIHGGYSREINENLLEAILDNDLGFEVGVLKGQLTNIHTLGSELTQKLLLQGEEATALNVALSCADRASKLVPQIQKALESPLTADFELDAKKQRQKNRWLKRFHAGECSASDVAYQFEVNNLGQPPLYVMKKLEAEIKSAPSDIDDAQYSREELQQQLMEYWQETASEEQLRNEREQAIQREKKRISDRFFNSSNASDSNQAG